MTSAPPPEQQAPAIFRAEVVEQAHDRLGQPVRPLGVASWVLSLFMISMLVTAVIFLSLAKYARRETVQGVLQPSAGALRVASLRTGVITAVDVREGQVVDTDTPLVTVAFDATMKDGRRLGEVLVSTSTEQAAALARQAAARRDLITRQREALAARRTALVDRRRRLDLDADMQGERVKLAEETAKAARKLWSEQLMSAVQYRQREEALIVARQGLANIETEMAAIPASLAELEADDMRLRAEGAEAAAASEANLAQLSERRASTAAETEVVLVAQKAGRIAALQAKPGGMVGAGQALAFILPDGVDLQAELWVPSRAAGFVQPGKQVRLMYDAYPYQRFGVGRGQIIEVSHAPVAPSELPVPIRTEESLYRVVVRLDAQEMQAYGRDWALSPGMKLTADIVLEEQSLIEWLFDRVRAAQKRAEPLGAR